MSFTLVTAGIFLACTEASVDPVASTGEISGAGKGNCPFTGEIADVFSHGGLKNAITQQCNNVERQLGKGNTADAVEKAFALIEQILGHHADGQTTGDDEAVATLLNALLVFVGGEAIFPATVDENTGAGPCDNDGCTIVSQSGIAGINVPPQTNLGMCFITFTLREFDPELFSGFDNYPFQFDFEITCPGNESELQLAQEVIYEPPATVGVCFADPPLGPTLDEVPAENRQLAHLPDGEEEPVLLTVAAADFLDDDDCEEASQLEEASLPFRALAKLEPISEFFVTPLWANPGRLGGLITAHSPIGPVDNRGQEEELIPTVTDLGLEEGSSCCGNITGGSASVTEDNEGGAPVFPGDVTIEIDQVEGDADQSVVFALDDGGGADFEIVCDGAASAEDQIEVPIGEFTVQAIFEETGTHEGSSSEPVSFDCTLG